MAGDASMQAVQAVDTLLFEVKFHNKRSQKTNNIKS